MADVTSAGIATSIANGTILTQWWFYVLWLLVTALGSALGVWMNERMKGDVAKSVWLAQESWKEKYRLYITLIDATEEITGALWNIFTDTRTLSQMPINQDSTEQDGLRMFPEHQQFLDRETIAIDKISAVSVAAELMLNEKAQKALEMIRKSRTRSIYVVNMSYRQRIDERLAAASEAKSLLLKAAREDLKI